MIPSLLKDLVTGGTGKGASAPAAVIFLERQGGLARMLPRSEQGRNVRARRPRKKQSHACRQLQLPL